VQYLEANYTVPPGPNGREIRWWSIDPTSGVTTSRVLPSAFNLPVGWEYQCQSDNIFFSTQIVTGPNEMAVGYNWWRLSVSSGAVSLLATVNNVQGDNQWAGWFHALALNDSVTYRQGFRNVSTQTNIGMAITDLSQSPAVTWWTATPFPANHDYYQTFEVTNAADYISLAFDMEGLFDVVRWTLATAGQPASARVIATLGNAALPPYFGDVADCVSCDASVYVAAVVELEPNSNFDQSVEQPPHSPLLSSPPPGWSVSDRLRSFWWCVCVLAGG
jgi:hypothetical protein